MMMAYPHLIKVQHAGTGSPDAQLVFLLANRQPGVVSVHNEARDAFVTLQVQKSLCDKGKSD
jgi:hypothetical protein